MKKMTKAVVSFILVLSMLIIQTPASVLASTIRYNISIINCTMVMGETKTFQLVAGVSPTKIMGQMGHRVTAADGDALISNIAQAIGHSYPSRNRLNVTMLATSEGYARLKPYYTAILPGNMSHVISETHYLIHVVSPEFSVSFDPNGGSCNTGTQKVQWNEPYSYYSPLPTPVRPGYYFDGWYTSEGAKVTNTTTFQSKSNVILYAHWSPKKCYVYFDPTDGEAPLEYKQVTYGEKYGELPIPTREGYTFTNWKTQREYGIAITSNTLIKEESDHMLYAAWKRNPDTTENGHLLNKTNAQPSSCTQDGYEAYWTCSTCGKMFQDSEALYEITKPLKIEAAAHNYKERTIPPTCLEDGYTVYTCTVCGDKYKGDYVNALGHTAEIIPAVDATCIKNGLTEGKKCTACGEILMPQKHVEKKDHDYKAATVKATMSQNGSTMTNCAVCGECIQNSVIYSPETVYMRQSSFEYSDRRIKPAVVVKDNMGNTISSNNYSISYDKNQSVGKAVVKITFKGNYSGTITKQFKINPKGTELLRLKPKAKAFMVEWKKQRIQTNGYEIQYSTNKSFKKNKKTKIIGKTACVSQTISKLMPKKKYYVRIRTFKSIGASKYYSPWSAVRKVTTLR